MTTKLLTPQEVSECLRVSQRTVERWLRDGTIPRIKLPSGKWRISEEVVKHILEGYYINPPS